VLLRAGRGQEFFKPVTRSNAAGSDEAGNVIETHEHKGYFKEL